MENEVKNETEKPAEDVSTQPVDETTKNDSEELANQAIAIAEAAAEKLAKAEADRDNYKQGMLAKDRKLKELKDQGYVVEDEHKLSLEDVERLLDEKLAKVKEPEGLHKQISELKKALVNRQGLPSTPTGNGTESQAPKAARWVDEPATAERLKQQGLDPDKVFENWKANQP